MRLRLARQRKHVDAGVVAWRDLKPNLATTPGVSRKVGASLSLPSFSCMPMKKEGMAAIK